MPTSTHSARKFTLRDLRKKRRLSQLALAISSGISQCRVSEIENKSNFRLSTLWRYINALGGELEVRVKMNGQIYKMELPPNS